MLALLALLVGCPKTTAPEPPVQTEEVAPTERTLQCEPGTVTVLHLNDVYRIDGLTDGRGGLARVRTLRSELEDCGPVLVTHAGDAFFPALLSKQFKGAQMVDVLNLLDGDPEAFDPFMVATFGNHEFDKWKLKYASLVNDRVQESQFTWLDTNITWANAADGSALVAAEQMVPSTIIEINHVKVGVFSVSTDKVMPEYATAIDNDHASIARDATAALREQGADVVIALTHLAVAEDMALLEALSADERPDVVLGGHDHEASVNTVDDVAILKGASDATEVAVVYLKVNDDRSVDVTWDDAFPTLGPDTPVADPMVTERVQYWLDTFDRDFCPDDAPDCLTAPLTTAGVDIIAGETDIRNYETNLGDWVTDLMREPFADTEVHGALVNSGSIRFNQNVSAGTTLTARFVEETFPYSVALYLVELKGTDVRRMIELGGTDWPGSGHWLQTSGFVYRHDGPSGAISDIHVQSADGLVPLDDTATYRLITTGYLIDKNMGDQDGYGDILSMSNVVEHPANTTALKLLVRAKLEAAGEAGVMMTHEGRICSQTRPDAACLLK